jgi:hypothetical protein
MLFECVGLSRYEILSSKFDRYILSVVKFLNKTCGYSISFFLFPKIKVAHKISRYLRGSDDLEYVC